MQGNSDLFSIICVFVWCVKMFEAIKGALGRMRSVVLQVCTVVTKSPFDIEAPT